MEVREMSSELRRLDQFKQLKMGDSVAIVKKEKIESYQKTWEGSCKILCKDGTVITLIGKVQRVESVLKKWQYPELIK